MGIMVAFSVFLCAVGVVAITNVVATDVYTSTIDPNPTPVPNPRRPKPNFNWDTIPIAFHGANRSGLYNDSTVEVLSKYQMVTIEKWYTECGSAHPIQNGPWCDVEHSMFTTFKAIKALNPNITIIMYLNSMMDFTMYKLHGMAMELEAKGTRVWLRDKNDVQISLCNDGNYYCNVTFWDWTKQAARELYTEHVMNATTQGLVDGIFADHATQMLVPPDKPQLCNGAGSSRKCYEFTPEFAEAFNAGHGWLVNHTQDMLAPRGGPVIDGPYGRWHIDVCDFDTLREAVALGQKGNAYVLEANSGGCTPDASCIASYLLAAEEFTYLSCLADVPTLPYYPDLSRPLGPPLGPAVQDPVTHIWSRNFTHGATARWYPDVNMGTVQWAGQPLPPKPVPPPTPPPVPPQKVTSNCGKLDKNTAVSDYDVAVKENSDSAQDCCDFCEKEKSNGCAIWSWHADQKECHAHYAKAAPNFHKKNDCYSGTLASTY